MKHTILILTLFIALSGCFDYEARPEPSAVGNILGCQAHEAGHVCVVHYSRIAETQPVPGTQQYECAIADIEQVYDGDTITDVRILVAAVNLEVAAELGEVFPNIVLKRDGVYVQNRIRITGIDTAEIRPSLTKSDGTRRSAVSRANEKKQRLRHGRL